MMQITAKGEELVKTTLGIYQFNLTGAGNKVKSWTVDLKTGPKGKVYEGTAQPKADVTLSMSDDDCVAMFSGKLNTQQAFMQGKLKIKGDMKFAMKLGPIIAGNSKL